MADVRGLFTKRVVTGYLVTNYRCFVWDGETDEVKASVPVARCEVVVSFMRKGVRSKRGGVFLIPPSAEDPDVRDEDRLSDHRGRLVQGGRQDRDGLPGGSGPAESQAPGGRAEVARRAPERRTCQRRGHGRSRDEPLESIEARLVELLFW